MRTKLFLTCDGNHSYQLFAEHRPLLVDGRFREAYDDEYICRLNPTDDIKSLDMQPGDVMEILTVPLRIYSGNDHAAKREFLFQEVMQYHRGGMRAGA